MNTSTNHIFIILFSVLTCLTLLRYLLLPKIITQTTLNTKYFYSRLDSWWISLLVLWLAHSLGNIASTIIFFILSFIVLREFMSLVYRKREDHNNIAIAFYLVLPIQFCLILTKQYYLASIFIPVYIFFLFPILANKTHASLQQETLSRISTIQIGLLVTIFGVSHLPAILTLPIKSFEQNNVLIILFMFLALQSSDIAKYIIDNFISNKGSHSTTINYLFYAISGSLIAIILHTLTPFSIFQAAIIGAIINLVGLLGHNMLEKLKQSYQVAGWGRLSYGQYGILDRIDKLCFTAPILFHILYTIY